MRLRLVVACSCIPLGAVIVWALGGTALGMLLEVLIVYAVVLGYALLFEAGSDQRAPLQGGPVEAPRGGSVRVVEGTRMSPARERGPERAAIAPERPPIPQMQPDAEPEPSFEASFPPVPQFERPASLLAGIASRVGPQPGEQAEQQEARSVPAGGRWNVWALERLATERLSKESDYERSLLLVYLRDFASSDGTLPAEFNGLVESTFPDLIRELASDRR